MFLSAASAIYAAAARWRRQWYARDPSRRRKLARPVVSVGNLTVGGTGKTPLVAHVARLLVARGERPAILSRGYGRREPVDGVTVVSDGSSIRASVERAGDEPLMLAHALDGVPVLVGADRYMSGLFAEERFGVTVHILDDGFQHLMLARDVDLLIASERDLSDRVLPAGSLREGLAAAANADALIVNDDGAETTERLQRELGISTAFHMRRELGSPRPLTAEPAELAENNRPSAGSASSAVIDVDEPVLAIAGIARPERFFNDLERIGWRLADTVAFPDHHPFSPGDLNRIASAARKASVRLVLTTEKDAVRLDGRNLRDVTIAAIPLTVTIEPPTFGDWLVEQIVSKRSVLSPQPPPSLDESAPSFGETSPAPSPSD